MSLKDASKATNTYTYTYTDRDMDTIQLLSKQNKRYSVVFINGSQLLATTLPPALLHNHIRETECREDVAERGRGRERETV